MGGDFNGHVGKKRDGYETVHGGYGFRDRNEAGVSILDFAVAYNLIIANTYFKKRHEHLITFKSRSNKNQIDFFLTRKVDKIACKDCKVILGESLTLQHRIMVADKWIKIKVNAKRKIINPKIKW